MKQCYFCTNNVKNIDYKNVELLKKYTDTFGRIANKRGTEVCAKHQRKLSMAIKRARIMALLPFVAR